MSVSQHRPDEELEPTTEPLKGAAGEAPVADPDPAEALAGEDDGAAGSGVPPEESHAELRDRWLRAEADLQNFRRRAARDREEGRRLAEEAVLLDMIEGLDDLDRALAAAPEATDKAWLDGLALAARRLTEVLHRRGVTVIDPEGRPFDPNQHDAMLQVPPAKGTKPGHVVKVVLKGWARDGRTLRPARVVVARADGSHGD